MRASLPTSGLAVLLLAASAGAQSLAPQPVHLAGVHPGTDLPVLRTDRAAVSALHASPALTLRLDDFALTDGRTVDLDLERVDLDRMTFGFHVDGVPTPGLLDLIEISAWAGTVDGAAGSDVFLTFSNVGVRGWVDDGAELVHLMPQPDAVNGWDDSYAIVASDDDLAGMGTTFDATCDASALPDLHAGSREALDGRPHDTSGGSQAATFAGSCSNWEATISIETDFQLFDIFGSLAAETSYVTSLLAAASMRYEGQIDTVLTYPYIQFYTTSADPWSTPDVPGSSSAMLNEFENAWSGNIPMDADIGHFLSGANLGGGIAYLGVLCDDANFSFAVSGNLHGMTPFPISVDPLNWDFMVFTHETGHNFNSPHTHDYTPQIDDCAGGACITNGTIMSYCHLCPGGLDNITTFFHPTVVAVMQAHANACLPFFAPLVEQGGPAIIAPGATTALTVDVQGTPVGDVLLEYRFDPNDPFSSVVAVDQGGGTYAATLPSGPCGQSAEWFFSMTDATCGPFQTPTATAEIGDQTVQVDDEFEAPSGWTAGAPGDTATTGIWTLGDPIGTGAQPEDDHTPSGTDCWFTGQGTGGSIGENDVDGGATTLLSPVYDLSGGGDPVISYWRWYSNDAGSEPNADVFVVDISDDGGASWTNVETVGPAGAGTSGGWILHSFDVSDFVTPTASVQLRFIAEDGAGGSIVEAAVDDLQVYTLSCDDPWVDLGGGAPGVAGVPQLDMTGPLTPGSTLGLSLTDGAPSALAVVWFSFTSTPAPFLGGTLHAFPIDIQLFAFTDVAGALGGSATFPGGTSGQMIWVQVGVTDASTAEGGSLSNAMVGTVP